MQVHAEVAKLNIDTPSMISANPNTKLDIDCLKITYKITYTAVPFTYTHICRTVCHTPAQAYLQPSGGTETVEHDDQQTDHREQTATEGHRSADSNPYSITQTYSW